MLTEETMQVTQDSKKYTLLSIVKERSLIHPNTSSTKIFKQYCLPEGAFIGKGRDILVFNEFLDENGVLKAQNGKVFRSNKKLPKLDTIINDTQKPIIEPDTPKIETDTNTSVIKFILSDYMSIKDLIKQERLKTLTRSVDVLALSDVPKDFFIGHRKGLRINPNYIGDNKQINISIDFSSLKPKQLKYYKNKTESYNTKKPDESIIPTSTSSEITTTKNVYANGPTILKELGDIVEALKPILLKTVLSNKNKNQSEITIEDTEEYKQLYQKYVTLEETHNDLKKAYKDAVHSLRVHSTEKSIGDLGEVVNKTEQDSLQIKLNDAIAINNNILTELEQLKYIKRHNVPGPIDISKIITDAEKLMLLIQKKAIEYGSVKIMPENNGFIIFSMSGMDRIIHYDSKQKNVLEHVQIVDRSKSYDLLFGEYKSRVEFIINDFLKVKIPCFDPIEMNLASLVYNKEISVHPRQEEEKYYVATLLFEKPFGQALISHGTDGTKANPVILRAITNTFKYHREKEFITLIESYLHDMNKAV